MVLFCISGTIQLQNLQLLAGTAPTSDRHPEVATRVMSTPVSIGVAPSVTIPASAITVGVPNVLIKIQFLFVLILLNALYCRCRLKD